MRRAAAVMLVIGVLLSAPGCAPLVSEACPAIGWINTVDVDASAYGDAGFVQLCVDGVCSPAPDAAEDDVELIPAVTGDAGVWSFSMVNTEPTPASVVVRIFEAGGALLEESEHDITWELSTARCGGPAIADRVVVGAP